MPDRDRIGESECIWMISNMEKPECTADYEQKKLVMSDNKCNKCPYLYECRYMIAEMNDVVYGGM